MNIISLEISHNFGKNFSIRKTAETPGDKSLMLARGGSYLWVGQTPVSRYQGWFFGFGRNGIIKVIEDIRIINRGKVEAIENNFWNVKKTGADFGESLFLPGKNCLVYELDRPGDVEFFLDIKEPYQNPESGRHHKVWKEDGLLLINYRQEAGNLLPEIYLAVCGDMADFEIREEWVSHDYALDRKRASGPWSRWVFAPAVLRTVSKMVFAVGFTKEEAAAAARDQWRDFEKIKKDKKKEYDGAKAENVFLPPGFGKKNGADETAMAARCAQNALKMLLSGSAATAGLRAGLPWFFQFWQRGEAVSLRGLHSFDEDAALKIFWRHMAELIIDDFRPINADGAGWLFLRAAELFKRGAFDGKEAAMIGACLGKEIDRLLETGTKGNLAVSAAGKTWMDAIGRDGAAIEIQALRLAMYSLAADLANDQKQKNRYLELEAGLSKAVRQLFFDGARLADLYDLDKGAADFTARPNIFLAAYIYPRLLSRSEWVVCFEYALSRLWLDWGGLSTIDKSAAGFHSRDTGEDPAAYHDGDSWFWVNNIAAIVMDRADRKRFKSRVDKIFMASVNDILWSGAIGCASEISSAESYGPAGCVNQAWSNATFLELRDELK